MDFETALREACFEADEIYLKSLFEQINSMPDVLIPKEKDERLRGFIRAYTVHSAPNNKNTGRIKRSIRAMIIAAALLLILTLTAFAFEPVRDFIYNIYEDSTEFIFRNKSKRNGDYLFAEYSYIPEGYVLISENRTESEQTIMLQNKMDRIIISSEKSNSLLGIDTEKAVTDKISVNGHDGYFSVNQSSIILVWSTGKHYHYIVADLNENISIDVVVQIAQSAKPIS